MDWREQRTLVGEELERIVELIDKYLDGEL